MKASPRKGFDKLDTADVDDRSALAIWIFFSPKMMGFEGKVTRRSPTTLLQRFTEAFASTVLERCNGHPRRSIRIV
jgi:hypothetical protein